nr:4-(cytidine 5'-diphospho)-2-C-methyl-D-erythritol kinase [Actinomycetota bacterium]
MVATRLCAAAKINLYLRVLRRRGDGFHEIETVFHSVSLADELAISERPGDHVEVEMRVETPSGAPLPALEENLVTIAARLLSARVTGPGHGGAYVEVLKRIPIGGGLAGGSADAAGALVGLNELWGLGLG